MYTPQQIREAYRKLSQDVREIISSPERVLVIKKIAVTYNLTEKQTTDLGELVDYVLMELGQESDLVAEIQKVLLIDTVIAGKINNDIKSQILDNINGLSNQIAYNIDQEQNVAVISTVSKEEINQKVIEISQKYSLSDVQKKTLENIITSGSISNIKQDLNVSDIVASQIEEEINNRFFKKPATTRTSSVELEIAPNTLPAIELGQIAHTTPAFSVPLKPIVQPAQQNAPLSETKISVPRYIAPADDEPSSPSAPAGTVPHNLPGQEVAPEKKYVADPYREPLN